MRERFSREERVLDFAVCLRLCVVEWSGEFLEAGERFGIASWVAKRFVGVARGAQSDAPTHAMAKARARRTQDYGGWG